MVVEESALVMVVSRQMEKKLLEVVSSLVNAMVVASHLEKVVCYLLLAAFVLLILNLLMEAVVSEID